MTLFNLSPSQQDWEQCSKSLVKTKKPIMGRTWIENQSFEPIFFLLDTQHEDKRHYVLNCALPSPPLHKSYVTSNPQYLRTWPYLDRAFREVTK